MSNACSCTRSPYQAVRPDITGTLPSPPLVHGEVNPLGTSEKLAIAREVLVSQESNHGCRHFPASYSHFTGMIGRLLYTTRE